ncbi:TPA: PI-1 pilus transcriptional regulator RlrA [Streptococcus pneumoniae]|nr:transcriptional regulator [Streptococcus pneumoniae]HEV4297677.1 PI-1 pilus transcriptional regulator RlrA [Streptococcus pneumoniae]
MLNKYIEKRITDKITILNILLDIRSIELDELSTLTSLQSKSLLSILQELQETFEEELTFNLDTQQVQLIEHHSHQTNYYFHQLYNQSTILKILRFFLLQGNQSFNEFTQKEYISIATGYRVRQKCGLLLRSVGLDLVKNQVVGPEYRIRFLIALLQFHFGIEIYDLNDGSMDWVTHMIVQSNSQLSHELLEITPDEYVHFSILVALTWKRREFPLEFPESKEFEKLKNLFMYPILMEHCQTYLEPHANMTFTQEELDYIFLVYCSANSSFSKDKWNQEKKTHTIQLILQHTRGKHLLSKFKNILGNDISNSLSFLTALTFLTRTFLFGLQNLVPYYNYYEHYGIESDKPLYHISKAIVQEWMTEQKIEGVIDQHRLYLFSLYLTETIFSSLPAIPIFIILNNQADVNLIKSIILRNFTDKVASVTGYNILISPPLSEEHLTEPLIIITTKEYLPYVKKQYPKGKHHFLTIALDLHVSQQRLIYQTIVDIRKEAFDKRVAMIAKKAHYLL